MKVAKRINRYAYRNGKGKVVKVRTHKRKYNKKLNRGIGLGEYNSPGYYSEVQKLGAANRHDNLILGDKLNKAVKRTIINLIPTVPLRETSAGANSSISSTLSGSKLFEELAVDEVG